MSMWYSVSDAVPGERAGARLVGPPGGRVPGHVPGGARRRRLRVRLCHRRRQRVPLQRHHHRLHQGLAHDQLPRAGEGNLT